MYRGATASGIQIPTNGLLINYDAAQLRSYPRDGTTTFTDLSGRGNNGTLTNGAAFNSLNGGSILLDGVDDYISLGVFNPGVNVSLSYWSCICWLRMSYLLSNRGIVSAYLNNPPTGGYGIGIQSDAGGGKLTLSMYATKSDGSNYYFASTTGMNWDTDYMVAATFDPASTGYAKIYINGLFDSSSFFFGGSIINISGQQYRVGSGTTGSPFMKGYIYSVQTYSVALTATEILQAYNATKSRFGL